MSDIIWIDKNDSQMSRRTATAVYFDCIPRMDKGSPPDPLIQFRAEQADTCRFEKCSLCSLCSLTSEQGFCRVFCS